MPNKSNKQIRSFLRERKLLGAFQRSQRIKRKINFQTTIDGHKRDLIAYKKNGKTIVADKFSLRTVATTTRYNTRNVQNVIKNRVVVIRKIGRRSKVGIKANEKQKIGDTSKPFKTSTLKLNEVSRTFFEKSLHVRRTRPLRNKIGKLDISVTFFGKNKERFTAEGGSARTRLLTDKKELNKSFNEAFRGALSFITFSYERFEINWMHFSYTLKRDTAVLRTQTGDKLLS